MATDQGTLGDRRDDGDQVDRVRGDRAVARDDPVRGGVGGIPVLQQIAVLHGLQDIAARAASN